MKTSEGFYPMKKKGSTPMHWIGNWLALPLSKAGDIHRKRIQEILICLLHFQSFLSWFSSPLLHEMLRLVAAGDFHTCAITADGKLHCFGSNDHGQCSVPKHLEHFIVSQPDAVSVRSWRYSDAFSMCLQSLKYWFPVSCALVARAVHFLVDTW